LYAGSNWTCAIQPPHGMRTPFPVIWCVKMRRVASHYIVPFVIGPSESSTRDLWVVLVWAMLVRRVFRVSKCVKKMMNSKQITNFRSNMIFIRSVAPPPRRTNLLDDDGITTLQGSFGSPCHSTINRRNVVVPQGDG
jgi:hypothetical protein